MTVFIIFSFCPTFIHIIKTSRWDSLSLKPTLATWLLGGALIDGKTRDRKECDKTEPIGSEGEGEDSVPGKGCNSIKNGISRTWLTWLFSISEAWERLWCRSEGRKEWDDIGWTSGEKKSDLELPPVCSIPGIIGFSSFFHVLLLSFSLKIGILPSSSSHLSNNANK